MNEKQKKFYTLIYMITITYRLSLENVCNLLDKDPTNENKQKMYEIFNLLFESNKYNKQCFNYLFNYETHREPENISNDAITSAYAFYAEYRVACQEKNKEELKRLMKELRKIDYEFKQIMCRDRSLKLTEEDYLIITQYRIKYALSKKTMCELLDVTRDSLRHYENKIIDEKLKYKIEKLNEFCLDMKKIKFKK